MVRGGKVSSKCKVKKRPQLKDKGSDDSDEEYVVSDEENEVSGDSDEDYCSGLDGCASEETYSSLAEEEEEEEVKNVRKAHRSKAKKYSDSFVVEEEEEEEGEEKEDDLEEEEEEIEEFKRTFRSKAQRSLSGGQRNGFKPSRKRQKVTYEDEGCEDLNHDADYSDDDEEFTPDEEDFSEEEGPKVKKKRSNMKAGKRRLQKKRSIRGQKRKRRSTFSNKSSKRPKNHRRCRRVNRNEDDKIESKRRQRKRTVFVPSDSDFESSRSSDYEYSMSEEDSVIREARESCGSLRTNLRSTSMSNIQEGGVIQQQRKPPVKKGKEKVEEVKAEVGKQVCGICLSEEDKRKVRGKLNCCTHYFCLTCIMEWAKVESRCPLCKQRFRTISRPAKSTVGIDPREVLIHVPERDQVYQPSEEELRSYLDPYESVSCTECNEGGDDALMLLCDICDSPAHTYCVGLGREVPEGNWYCHGCRPFALGSSSSQGHLPDQRTTTNNFSNSTFSAINHFGEGIDLNLVSSPHASFAQGSGNLSSPRFSLGGTGSSPPFSGSGAPTVSGRRMLHRHIQQIISANRMNMASRNEFNVIANMDGILLNSQTNQGNEATILHTGTPETGTLYHTFLEDRLRDSLLPSVQENDFLSPRLSQLSRQFVQEPTTNTNNRPVSGATRHGVTWMDSVSAQPIHDHNNRPNIGYDCEESYLHVAKEQLPSVVKNHLKNLSRDCNLGQNSLDDIARSCVHTVLAACGYEHRKDEVVSVPTPSICSHMELMAGGKTSLMRGCCSSCFDSFVRDVVKRILDTRTQPWLSLAL